MGGKRRTHGANVVESVERSLLSLHWFSCKSHLLNGGMWSQYRILPKPAKKCKQSGRHSCALLSDVCLQISVTVRQTQVYSVTVCHAKQTVRVTCGEIQCEPHSARVLR